jgi:thiamine biosynthesis protein ThiI
VKHNLILVRYGEIALKGKETRRRFEDTLISNIKNAFSRSKIDCKIRKERGRIFIITSKIDKSIILLKKIFGINSISPAFKTNSSLDEISDLALQISKNKINKKSSFAIRVTRTGGHSYSSQDVAKKVGSDIVDKTKASVNLTNPDFELFIEVRNKECYIFTEKVKCVSGMPVGTQGNVLALIDNYHSILAAWYMLRRGCNVIFLKNNLSIGDSIEKFTDNWLINSKILDTNSNKSLFDEINDVALKNNCEAVVTGHTLSNDVIHEIRELKKQVQFPVLHPLISMVNKQINEKSKKIGLIT